MNVPWPWSRMNLGPTYVRFDKPMFFYVLLQAALIGFAIGVLVA